MVLGIFRHGRLPWEEEEEEGEGEGDEFDNDRCSTSSTPFGNHAERQSLLQMETLGGTTATAKIAIAEEKRQRGGGNGRTRKQMALDSF